MTGAFRYSFKISLLAAVMLMLPGISLSAAETNANNPNSQPVNIEADRMDYDSDHEIFRAHGNAVIIYSGGVLTADDVELDKKNNIATAQGNALLKMGEDTLAGDKIEFNIENKTGVAYNSHAFYARNHFYIKGTKIEKTGDATYFIEKPVATTCDGASPEWEIAGSEMKVTIEGYGLMKNARLLIKDVPVFYSPFIPFPAKTRRQSGFLFPYLSYSQNTNGIDVEIPYFWAISPEMDATFYQRYIEKRGFKEGVEFRYYAGSNSFGTLYGDYLDDKKNITENIGGISRDWEDTHKRWSYYLNHQTNFDSSFYFRTDLKKVSDNWYFKDFTNHNYYLDHYALSETDPFKKVPFWGDESLRSLESTARLYKGWSNFSLTAVVSSVDDFSVINNDGTLQRYPEITFTAIKQPLFKTPVYYEMAGVYDYFYRGAGQKGHIIDIAPTLSVPFNISHYARITPQVAFKETYWSRDDQGETDYKSGSRTVYNASLAVSSQISRIFDVKVQNWEKIRHEIKPEITYSYIPNVKQNGIPDFTPTLIPAAKTAVVPTAGTPIAEQNAVTVALTNTFTAKLREPNGSPSYLEFLRIKLFQTYDINEASRDITLDSPNERRSFSDVGLEVDFSPHKYLSFMARNIYSTSAGWKQTNYDMNISDWRGDFLTFGYRYTADAIEEININLKAVITKEIDAIAIARRDQFNSRTVENTVGVLYHKQCWAVGVDYTKTDTDTRVMLKISLAGLANLGL